MVMDLFIETLAGTSFEMRVSPFETIMGVKMKIQRLEGIPVAQQHLIWRSMELKDDYCLHDYSISNGSILKLVLAMRGGPVNTRRVTVEDPTLREMAEYMESNRDELWDKLIRDDNPVTLLVYKDGDQLNFFRVYDRNDGTLTPLSDAISPGSLCGIPTDENADDTVEDIEAALLEKQKENEMTRMKLAALRQKMALSKRTTNKDLTPHPPTIEKSEIFDRRSQCTPQSQRKHRIKDVHTSYSASISRDPLPPLTHKSASLLPNRQSRDPLDIHSSTTFRDEISSRPTETVESPFQRSTAPLPSVRTSSGGRRSVQYEQNDNIDIDRVLSRSRQSLAVKDQLASTGIQRSARRTTLRRVVDLIPENKLISNEETPTKLKADSKVQRNLYDTYTHFSPRDKDNSLSLLPDTLQKSKNVSATVTSKRQRCLFCRKRLGIATTFECRCQNKFCSVHRYPETHQCPYDYKTEGRKTLQRNNPIVTAPKLPKI